MKEFILMLDITEANNADLCYMDYDRQILSIIVENDQQMTQIKEFVERNKTERCGVTWCGDEIHHFIANFKHKKVDEDYLLNPTYPICGIGAITSLICFKKQTQKVCVHCKQDHIDAAGLRLPCDFPIVIKNIHSWHGSVESALLDNPLISKSEYLTMKELAWDRSVFSIVITEPDKVFIV